MFTSKPHYFFICMLTILYAASPLHIHANSPTTQELTEAFYGAVDRHAQNQLYLQDRFNKDQHALLNKQAIINVGVMLLGTGISLLVGYAAKKIFAYQSIEPTPKNNLYSFQDIAGAREAKEELQEVVELLKHPKKYKKSSAKVPKGFLLVGPPGTGKTLLAKAVAGESNCTFFNINGSEFINDPFIGTGAARVRALFQRARMQGPSIIFIDEIDAVAGSRNTLSFGSNQQEQTLNQLLTEMDGFTASNTPVIVIGATNRLEMLDKALLRPGRFDRIIQVDLPDLVEREAIIAVHLKRYTHAPDVNAKIIAQRTTGFSGADLANLINQASLFALRENKNDFEMHHIEDAYDRLLLGKEKKHVAFQKKERTLTAYHEAGHTLIRILLANSLYSLHKVTIMPRGDTLGTSHFRPNYEIHSQSREDMLDEIAVLMGGRAAEELQFSYIGTGPSNDLQQATQIAQKIVQSGMSSLGLAVYTPNQQGMMQCSTAMHEKIDQEVEDILQTQYKRAQELLRKHKDKLDTLAQTLIKHETLSADEVHTLLGIKLNS